MNGCTCNTELDGVFKCFSHFCTDRCFQVVNLHIVVIYFTVTISILFSWSKLEIITASCNTAAILCSHFTRSTVKTSTIRD